MEENSFAQQIPGPSGPAAGSNYMDGVQYGSSSEQHGEASAQAIPPWVLPDIGGTSDRNDNGVGNWGEDGQPNPDASADPQHPAAVQQAFRGPASLVKYNNRDNMLQTSAGQASGGQSRARQFQQVRTHHILAAHTSVSSATVTSLHTTTSTTASCPNISAP